MTGIEILSNIVNCIGSTINMIGINIKDKRKVLLFFIFGNLFVSISLGMLGAIVGMIVQLVFVVETIINYFWEKNHEKYPIWLMLLYVAIPCTILIIKFESAWDYLPIAAGVLFPLALLSNNFKLRLLNLLSVVVWIPYSFHFKQYVGAISCMIFTFINLSAIIRLDINKTKAIDDNS